MNAPGTTGIRGVEMIQIETEDTTVMKVKEMVIQADVEKRIEIMLKETTTDIDVMELPKEIEPTLVEKEVVETTEKETMGDINHPGQIPEIQIPLKMNLSMKILTEKIAEIAEVMIVTEIMIEIVVPTDTVETEMINIMNVSLFY